VCPYRAAVSVTQQSETDLVDKSGRSTANTATTTGTGLSSRAGRDTKSYVPLLLLSSTYL